ncbi:hypothetical protein LY76DRAFT_332514 [Colletotrichum caudatum]|nr:hypothetical protein LY76DRAFT_332514 [Colletotrichum caudatum]
MKTVKVTRKSPQIYLHSNSLPTALHSWPDFISLLALFYSSFFFLVGNAALSARGHWDPLLCRCPVEVSGGGGCVAMQHFFHSGGDEKLPSSCDRGIFPGRPLSLFVLFSSATRKWQAEACVFVSWRYTRPGRNGLPDLPAYLPTSIPVHARPRP